MPTLKLSNTGDQKQRVDFLTTFIHSAGQREQYIGELRQKNFSVAIVIFAALISFSSTAPTKTVACGASFALIIIVSIFLYLDRRQHRYIHGWRGSRWDLMRNTCKLIDDATINIEVEAYDYRHESRAERWAPMPITYYALFTAAIANFTYVLLMFPKPW